MAVDDHILLGNCSAGGHMNITDNAKYMYPNIIMQMYPSIGEKYNAACRTIPRGTSKVSSEMGSYRNPELSPIFFKTKGVHNGKIQHRKVNWKQS